MPGNDKQEKVSGKISSFDFLARVIYMYLSFPLGLERIDICPKIRMDKA